MLTLTLGKESRLLCDNQEGVSPSFFAQIFNSLDAETSNSNEFMLNSLQSE